MSDPLIVATTARIKHGMLDDYKQFNRSTSEPVEANETRIIAFHGFLNEEVTKATLVQVHTDTAPMEFHAPVFADNGTSPSASIPRCSKSSGSTTTGQHLSVPWRWIGISASHSASGPGPMPGFVRSPASRF